MDNVIRADTPDDQVKKSQQPRRGQDRMTANDRQDTGESLSQKTGWIRRPFELLIVAVPSERKDSTFTYRRVFEPR